MPDVFAEGLAKLVPQAWRAALAPVAAKINEVDAFVEADRKTHNVFPARELTFNALAHTSLKDVKVVIIGQDPYPTAGNAMGLSFSVPDTVKPLPASLKNIFAELDKDLGIPPAATGDLTKWAERGVLLLNTVLTVRESAPASHRRKGWEEITDQILQQVNAKDEKVVFLLLGADAQKLGKKIDTSKHTIVARSHPSPLSVKTNFTGTKPFSEINAALVANGQTPIDWRL